MLQELFKQDCYMLDIESNGLSPITNGMTSFCLVKFKLDARNLHETVVAWSHHRINTAINVDMYRVRDDETVQFRREAGIDEAESELPRIDSVQDIAKTIKNFHTATKTGSHPSHIFALHTEFDISFLRGYYEHAGDEFPFPHRNIWEISSMIKGMNQDLKSIRDEIEDVGLMEDVSTQFHVDNFRPHNALYDCIRQVAFLRLSLMRAGIM